jgi:alpha,alpha-trehalase
MEKSIRLLSSVAVLVTGLLASSALGQTNTVPPSVLYGDLYVDVELKRIFPDSKTFPDMSPNGDPKRIVEAYNELRRQPGFDETELKKFVADNFTGPELGPSIDPASPGQTLPSYISQLWDGLQQYTSEDPKSPDHAAASFSLLWLPNPYVVPGGRFREAYYWDTYFTMIGLEEDGRRDLALGMLENFASMIERYGHVPNGNRTYYLSRSQPPLFSHMVELVAKYEGERILLKFLPKLEAEYRYWMEGAHSLDRGDAYRNMVRLKNGIILNRYWDERDVPRDESYYEDYHTALSSPRHKANDLYRSLRAAAESGWDFSSRWFADGKSLSTIRTLDIIPVDLNCLLVHLEQTIAQAHRLRGHFREAMRYRLRAEERSAAIRQFMWDRHIHAFSDYLWRDHRPTHVVTAAALVPLFTGVASREQAEHVAHTVRRELLMAGGLATTTVVSGQQWDLPNGWAPLQWMAVAGLNRYHEEKLAKTIAERWVQKNIDGFVQTGKLVEKYDVTTVGGDAGTGGEYATQIGFGWTNGVLLGMAALYPDLAAKVAAATPLGAWSAPPRCPPPTKQRSAADSSAWPQESRRNR